MSNEALASASSSSSSAGPSCRLKSQSPIPSPKFTEAHSRHCKRCLLHSQLLAIPFLRPEPISRSLHNSYWPTREAGLPIHGIRDIPNTSEGLLFTWAFFGHRKSLAFPHDGRSITSGCREGLCTALRVDLPRFLIALRMARVGVPVVYSLLALRSAQEIPETRLMGTRCETLICCMLVCDAFEAFPEVIGSFDQAGADQGAQSLKYPAALCSSPYFNTIDFTMDSQNYFSGT